MESTPLKWLMLDGVLQEAARAGISPLGDGFLLGHALFETLKVVSGVPVFLPLHAERLARSASAVGLAWTGDAALRQRCQRVISENGLDRGALKIVVFEEFGRTRELIVAREFVYAAELYRRGYQLKSARDARVLDRDPAHKSTNYLSSQMARRNARRVGADEVLFLDASDRVLECAGSNLFAVIDGQAITPPAAGILPGTVRRLLLESGLAGARERILLRSDLEKAEELFITNALLGVMPVAGWDQATYSIEKNAVTRALMSAVAEWERKDVEANLR